LAVPDAGLVANAKMPEAVADAAAVEEPFVPKSPPAAWATWPMPNSPGHGLPNQQKFETTIPGVVVDEKKIEQGEEKTKKCYIATS